MTRNTFFAAMMFCLMAMVSNNAQAQRHRGEGGGGRGYNVEMRGMRDSGYDRPGNRGMCDMRGYDMGPGRDARMGGPRHGGYREMYGHRWDHEGWMAGYHGRVRHFDDGRWGYLRDGRWFYYDCFYEPDFYYAHPVAHFHSHLMTPTERRVVGAAVGVAAVAGFIAALVR